MEVRYAVEYKNNDVSGWKLLIVKASLPDAEQEAELLKGDPHANAIRIVKRETISLWERFK